MRRHVPHHRAARAALVAGVIVGRAVPAGAAADPPAEAPGTSAPRDAIADPDLAHLRVLVNERYPSAATCRECHPVHYEQWSVSQHGYAQISPVFNAMNARILELTNGTTGDFCLRCHTPVGMALGEPLLVSNANRHPISREGVTCIVCHRVNKAYGKVNARFAIAAGPITEPVKGPTGDNAELERFLRAGAATDDPRQPGRRIHGRIGKFFELTTAASCGMCHDVTLANGLREIEAFSEYKSSPAARRGVTCQDCHMGREPGVYTGAPETNYPCGPAARVGDRWTEPRKLTNHMIVGADFPIVHPAIFPHDPRAVREEGDPSGPGLATLREWLQFDWQTGWGTDAFEGAVSEDLEFPERWATVDDRLDAREIVDEHLRLLERAAGDRLTLLRNGYELGPIIVTRAERKEIRLEIPVRNRTDGHGVPTSLDAERPVWLHVVIADHRGDIVLESGDLDPNGDLRDRQSAFVRNGELPLDEQLFNLQSKFITRNLRGGEREQVLPVPYSVSPLPFVRPARSATVLLGSSPDVRRHKMNIEPLGERRARYRLKGRSLDTGAPYTVTVELKAAIVPVSLIDEIGDAGFDYGMTARQVAEAVVAAHVVLWSRQVVIDVPAR